MIANGRCVDVSQPQKVKLIRTCADDDFYFCIRLTRTAFCK